ncbi:MAG: thioredoxin family protein [Blastocatellia bacterium]|nr:thioredoxin family protein [Blastocatellia bacterium]
MRLVQRLFLHISFLLLLTSAVFAEPARTEHVEAELVSETETIEPGKPFWVALRMKMKEHWHIYWINPGDSGLATKIKWKLPEGFTADPIIWPYPEKIVVDPLVSFGYHDEVFLLVKMNAPASLKDGSKIELSATADWLVCKEECIPEKGEVSLQLSVANATPTPSRWADSFSKTRQKLPVVPSGWKFTATSKAGKIVLDMTAPADFKEELSDLTLFPRREGILDYTTPQEFKKTPEGYTVELTKSSFATEILPEFEAVVVVGKGWRGPNAESAMQINATLTGEGVKAASTAVSSTAGTKPTVQGSGEVTSLWLALIFSFVGGLILNLMPCVLPVLSIKVLDFVKQANKENGKPWQHGLIFTLGVLVSFWVLAGSMLALRAGGEQLGWGFQLQSPKFLIILSMLLFMLGLNLFGVFEVGTSLMGVGGKAIEDSSQHSSWLGSFTSGALATAVATPCTAPFMGSALGFSLTQPAWASMLIFTALGLGMAAPYILLSASPTMLKLVPRPGAWMESFKNLMGFLLMGTIVWLGWVLGNQAGPDALAGLMGAFVLAGFGAWILGRWGSIVNTFQSRVIARTVLIVMLAVGLYIAISVANSSVQALSASKGTVRSYGIDWEPFSPEKVKELREAGKPIFIDFTAAWCLSCQVNERVTFTSDEVKEEFKRRGIVTMKADWTNRDETIAKTLAEFGRNGVPLYVIYSKDPNQPPVVLPEVITPSIVLAELRKL